MTRVSCTCVVLWPLKCQDCVRCASISPGYKIYQDIFALLIRFFLAQHREDLNHICSSCLRESQRLVLFSVCLFIWALGTGIYGFKMVIVITYGDYSYRVIGSCGELVC